jgi:hypothetical protein
MSFAVFPTTMFGNKPAWKVRKLYYFSREVIIIKKTNNKVQQNAKGKTVRLNLPSSFSQAGPRGLCAIEHPECCGRVV